MACTVWMWSMGSRGWEASCSKGYWRQNNLTRYFPVAITRTVPCAMLRNSGRVRVTLLRRQHSLMDVRAVVSGVLMRLPTLYESTHEFPWYFCDFIRFFNQRHQYCVLLPQHSHAALCAPHAHLAQPHVGSGSAPPWTAGIPWNTWGLATCSVHFQWSSSTAFWLNPVLPCTCQSRPSH
jgi:hypothetical protein